LSKPTTTWFSLGQMVMLLHHGDEGMRYSITGTVVWIRFTMRSWQLISKF
jgi:Tfp pilus assembly protein PilZ